MKNQISAIVACGWLLALSISRAESDGRWVNKGFITTTNSAESDFRIDFVCLYQSQPFFKHSLYFKQNWQYLSKDHWGFGRGMVTSSIGCGPSGSTRATISAQSSDFGIGIDFSAKRSFNDQKSLPIEVKQHLAIHWDAFPYSQTEGNFAYEATFSRNKND